MSHMRELGPIVYGEEYFDVIQYCQRKSILKSQQTCSVCGSRMSLQTRTKQNGSQDGYTWRCTKTTCRTMKSIRSGSFFEKSKIPLEKWLLSIHHWASNSKVQLAADAIGISHTSVMQCNKFLCEICSRKLCQVPIVLGGPGVVVQIDESLFSHKVKAHRGRPPTQEVWVFGIVDTSYKPALGYMQIVNRRDSATLLPIIQASVAPGSIVHSDEWSAYRQIQSQTGLTHRTVNHSLHFVSPTGVHTNNVESYWNRAKMKIKAMRGCTRDELSLYLDEFMWKERYGKTAADCFNNMLSHIAEFY